MKFMIRTGLIGVGALALAACGDSNDASDEVVADNVEVPADEALADIDEVPVEDEAVTPPPAPVPTNTQTSEERAAAERERMQDDAEAAEAAAADIMAEIEGTEN